MELVPETTVYQLLLQLVPHDEIFENENIREDVTVLLNGTIINHTETCEIILEPGDVVALLPIFPGGGT